MIEMSEDTKDTIKQISVKTLIPMGLVAVVVSLAWGLATDRSDALSRIKWSEEKIERLEQKNRQLITKMEQTRLMIYQLSESMVRVETRLGTLPPGERTGAAPGTNNLELKEQ